ncbi:MAG TPA: gamma-glutamyl-gamma-aminobutyrate hydrolase [Holosporales bacterium]|nr:gamma-glutamyl-gamma-aminobutyrate hydrolase [Holosporales bacterium]
MMKPKIGITIDSFNPELNEAGRDYSAYYWYAMRSHVVNAVVQCGGIPVLLSHHVEIVDEYADMLDGLIISGGGLDVPPEYYGEKPHKNFRPNLKRSAFEKAIAEKFIENKKPLLGICGGMQLLAVLYGGKLYQCLNDENCFDTHDQKQPYSNPAHTVDYQVGTKLWSLIGKPAESVGVNTVHRQGVKDAGRLVVNAISTNDGLIEGIEDANHPFCIGVQWHPEFICSHYDEQIFIQLIKSAQA